VSLLAAAGAAVDAPNEDGLAPLHWAAAVGAADCVAALLAAGASPGVRRPVES
jgi:ankyrin repeat protein